MTVLVPLEKAPIELASLDNTSITDQTTCTLQREKVWILVAEDNNLIRSIITKTLSKSAGRSPQSAIRTSADALLRQ